MVADIAEDRGHAVVDAIVTVLVTFGILLILETDVTVIWSKAYLQRVTKPWLRYQTRELCR